MNENRDLSCLCNTHQILSSVVRMQVKIFRLLIRLSKNETRSGFEFCFSKYRSVSDQNASIRTLLLLVSFAFITGPCAYYCLTVFRSFRDVLSLFYWIEYWVSIFINMFMHCNLQIWLQRYLCVVLVYIDAQSQLQSVQNKIMHLYICKVFF